MAARSSVRHVFLGTDRDGWLASMALASCLTAAVVVERAIGDGLEPTVGLVAAVGAAAAGALVFGRLKPAFVRWFWGGLAAGSATVVTYRVLLELEVSSLGLFILAGAFVLPVVLAATVAFHYGHVLPSALAPIALWTVLAYPVAGEQYVYLLDDDLTTTMVLIRTAVLALVFGGTLALAGFTFGVSARLEFGPVTDPDPWYTAVSIGIVGLIPATLLGLILLPFPLAVIVYVIPLCCGALVLLVN